LDNRDEPADGDRLPLLADDLHDRAGYRRRDVGGYLVGRHFDQWLVFIDPLANCLQPGAEGPFGDALAQLGHRDLRSLDCARHNCQLSSSSLTSGATTLMD